MPRKDHGEEKFFYFVDNVRYETDQKTVTGALIKAKIPNFVTSTGLILESTGEESDQLVGDDTQISLETESGPRRLFTVPAATFGMS